MKFAKAKYDENTVLPVDFKFINELRWTGSGTDPRKSQLVERMTSQPAAFDFASFLELIRRDFDDERIKKALTMLKKESFQLFFEQSEAGISGIVKSQTDQDLLYACMLNSDGAFGCCTQNLNPCGGLRGSLCKHILCLVVGLTKSGAVEAVPTAQSIVASKKARPLPDKAAMTALFLRYAGAQSGEVDWRPTETLPEDYYSF